MTTLDIVRHRLGRQLGPHAFATPAEAVRWFGAVQAQDYLGALWAVGLRVPGAREADVERAIAGRSIVRTWPLRGTIHFVAAEDARWMLELVGPRMMAGHTRRLAQFDIDDAMLARSRKTLARLLRDGVPRTRKATYAALEAARVSMTAQRGLHILWRLAQEGLVCFGPRAGKQPTFTLLDAWLPPAKKRTRDEALAELTGRYFTAHGPATVRDFAWWSGLAPAEARSGVAMMKSTLVQAQVGDETYWFSGDALPSAARLPPAHLLPAFDEYVVAYRDRAAVLADPRSLDGGGGMLAPVMLVAGRVVGTWRRTLERDGAVVALSPFRRLSGVARRALGAAAKAYGAFLGRPVSVIVSEVGRTT